jgi:uncharacterized membrane protein HdeD (DUF308 family)
MNLSNSQTSLIFAALTVIAFCIGFAPIPLTAVICYPSAILFGLMALISGAISLRRGDNASAQWMAWVGLSVGALVIVIVICLTALTILFIPIIQDWLSQIQ